MDRTYLIGWYHLHDQFISCDYFINLFIQSPINKFEDFLSLLLSRRFFRFLSL